MGDVDGAALAAVGHVDGVGLTGLGDYNESSFIANGGLDDDDLNDFDIFTSDSTVTDDPAVLYEYTTGNVGLFVSVTNPGFESEITLDGTTFEADGVAWAIGANYTTDAYKFGIGYEDLDVDQIGGSGNIGADHLFLGADATFGAFTGKLRWGQADINLTDGLAGGFNEDVEFDQWSLSGTYAMDAVSVTGFYMNKDFSGNLIDTGFTVDGDSVLSEIDTIGLGASYDLGGGAKVIGGVIDQERTAGDGTSVSDTSFDFGVSFSF
jgi:outer membrane protein OmpU